MNETGLSMRRTFVSRFYFWIGLLYGIGTFFAFLPLHVADQYSVRVFLSYVGYAIVGIPYLSLKALLSPDPRPFFATNGFSNPIGMSYPPSLAEYVAAFVAMMTVGTFIYAILRWTIRKHWWPTIVLSVLLVTQSGFSSLLIWFSVHEEYVDHGVLFPPPLTSTCERDLESVSIRIIGYQSYSDDRFIQIRTSESEVWEDLWFLSGRFLGLSCNDFYTSESIIWGQYGNLLMLSKDGGTTWSIWGPGLLSPPLEDHNWWYSQIDSIHFESPTRGEMRLVPNSNIADQLGDLEFETFDGGLNWSVVSSNP